VNEFFQTKYKINRYLNLAQSLLFDIIETKISNDGNKYQK